VRLFIPAQQTALELTMRLSLGLLSGILDLQHHKDMDIIWIG
jgi:hypothetical protein